MASLFNPNYQPLWALALAIALFIPARKLIWVLAVRRAEKKHGPIDEAMQAKLRKRTTVTAALLCFVFAYVYTAQLF